MSIFIIKILFILIAIAFFTLAERKVMAAIQRRRGPNVVGFLGIGQPIADGAKLVIKQLLFPKKIEKQLFILAPLLIIILSITTWILIPGFVTAENAKNAAFWLDTTTISFVKNKIFFSFTQNIFFFSATQLSLILLLTISSLNVYGIISAGWSSYSKYAFLGALRSSAQMISYEVTIGLIILPILLLSTSFNFTEIIINQYNFYYNGIFLFPLIIFFFISILAETNRTPFDLPEAEAELVAGYNVEYSSIIFAMFFLGEYSNMLIMSCLINLLFFGGSYVPGFNLLHGITIFFFSFKIVCGCFTFILIRALLPRYKYNQLMSLGWKLFLPLTFSLLCFIQCFLIFF